MVSGNCWDCGCRLSASKWGYCADCKAMARANSKRKRSRPIVRTPGDMRAYREGIEYRRSQASGFSKSTFLLRLTALDRYSSGSFSCGWCGIADIDVLCIDHIEGDGAAHRAGLGNQSVFQWLKKHDYPGGFQVLCRNCNQKKYLVQR